jgi:hypothetical protein
MINCHCKICQGSRGSALSTIALCPRDALSLEGNLKGYEYAGDSGRKLETTFCPDGGAPVLLNIRAMPDVVLIKVGSVDDTTWFESIVDIWTDSAQNWFAENADRKQFAKNPG